jgi:hypothetical protein
MSVSSIGATNGDLLQQLLQSQKQTSGAATTAQTVPADSPTTDPMIAVLEATGLDATDATSLDQKIKAAVSAAIQTAENSGDTSDLKSVISGAVDQTLQANGIDPTKLKQQLGAIGGQSQQTNPLTAALEATGLSAADATSITQKVQAAVSAAIQAAQSSGNTSNLQTVISNAVNQALDANGVDPTKVDQQLSAANGHSGHHHGHKTGGTSDSDASSSGTSQTSNSATAQVDPATAALLAELWGAQSGSTTLTGYLLDAKQ